MEGSLLFCARVYFKHLFSVLESISSISLQPLGLRRVGRVLFCIFFFPCSISVSDGRDSRGCAARKVTWLKASGNRLSPSLTIVAGMSTLRLCDVAGNSLASLDGLASCRQLRVLIANNNDIRNVSGLLSLRRGGGGSTSGGGLAEVGGSNGNGGRGTLSASYPGLASAAASSSAPAPLECLILSHNRIAAVPAAALVALPSLRKLSLSHNCLRCMYPYTLHPTPYTLHPTPYTLHPTPYTLHPRP
jgi:Leucine-rich repeat (LRR) protein